MLYWNAWSELRYDRQYGALGGETPISFVALDAYARRFEIAGAAFDTFSRMIKAMDGVWLDYAASQATKSDDTSPRSG